MVVEAAPLVVHHDERSAFPVLRPGERGEHVAQEPLAGADVGTRMVVGAVVAEEGGIDEDDAGELARLRLREVVRDRVRECVEPAAPQRQHGQVGVVVRGGDAGLPEPVPDRLPVVPAGGERQHVRLVVA